ncbi:MAG: hypothetical protein GY811_16640 [Myxococcales bacterium]|nr:hypothetical protein [Myxococcales bacterium]
MSLGTKSRVYPIAEVMSTAGFAETCPREIGLEPSPVFLPKAKRICNLYIRPTKNALVVCVDEEPMQVLERKHPTHVDPRDGSVRYEYE